MPSGRPIGPGAARRAIPDAGRASARPPAQNTHAVTAGISQSQSTPAWTAHAVATAASAPHAGARSRSARHHSAPSITTSAMPSSAIPTMPISPSVSR